MGPIVRHSGEHRRHDHAGVDPGVRQLPERGEPHGGPRRAHFELLDQRHVHGDQRDVDLEIRTGRETAQHVEVLGDERALGDDPDGEAFITRQALEDGPGQMEPPLRGLIRIGGGADHNGGRAVRWPGGQKIASQIGVQRAP